MLQVHDARATRLTRLILALAALLGLAGGACSAEGLAFRRDDRVRIVTPKDRAQVTLPVTIRWITRDLEIGGSSGNAFGVLVDRAPPAPGDTLESLIEDPGCRVQDGCPDAAYLANQNIFKTTAASHVIERIGGLGVEGRRERHEVTIVILGPDGRRRGEHAYSVEFELRRDET